MAIKNKKLDEMLRQLAIQERQKKFEKMGLYFTTCSAFGIPWWTWYWMIGARGRGKSYAALETVLWFIRKYGQQNVKCYYFRISDASVKTMLANNGAKAVDQGLRRKYDLDLEVHGYSLYNKGKPFIDFYPLVSAAKKGKGVAEYDPEFLGKRPEGQKRFVFLLIDEFMIDETQEKRSIGNPVKQFKMYFENIMRDQEQLDYRAVMVLGCANNVSECNDFLAEICGFIPTYPGRYKLKRKHMIIDMIPNSKAYLEKRKRSIGADIMDLDEDENYTNIVKRDLETLIKRGTKLKTPTRIIKFSKDKKDWFTVWDNDIIKKYTNQPFKSYQVTSMKRYLDNQYDPEKVMQVIQMQDARFFRFADLISQASFIANLKLIRK